MYQSPVHLRECAQHCLNCYRICLDTVTSHCLERGGDHAEPRHVRLMLDCAELCRTAADFVIRHSEVHGQICRLCAQLCERCASECDAFADDRMRACAELCRECAASCMEATAATT